MPSETPDNRPKVPPKIVVQLILNTETGQMQIQVPQGMKGVVLNMVLDAAKTILNQRDQVILQPRGNGSIPHG